MDVLGQAPDVWLATPKPTPGQEAKTQFRGQGVKMSEPAMHDQNETRQRGFSKKSSTTDRPSMQVAKDLRGLTQLGLVPYRAPRSSRA
jgi:hypothetical protein